MSESRDLAEFVCALARLPDGYMEGLFTGRRWSATVRRSEDSRRIWLFAEDLCGTAIVSFNLYVLAGDRPLLKPCEMSSDKVIEFVLGFQPLGGQSSMAANRICRSRPSETCPTPPS
ncbi:hypothetical protein [Ferirhizobium litorale]|nr:hypothetical protein [Fererhizobium litorale]